MSNRWLGRSEGEEIDELIYYTVYHISDTICLKRAGAS